MKLIKEIKEQYAYLWWWLLNQGIPIAGVLVLLFLGGIFIMCMVAFAFFLKWLDMH